MGFCMAWGMPALEFKDYELLTESSEAMVYIAII